MVVNKINIRPGVSILSILPHLNYSPWYALAEFIDNSYQSYLDNKDGIIQIDGSDFKLKVEIDIERNDNGKIVIRDNAAGIHEKDFARAFRPAELPPDRTGLCEFGMGMKSAACWFSPTWKVRRLTGGIAPGLESSTSRMCGAYFHECSPDLRT